LIFQISGQGRKFKKITLGVPLFRNAKGIGFSFLRRPQIIIFYLFIG
jgi:hypothetical protein